MVLIDNDNILARRERARLYYRHLDLNRHAEVDLHHKLAMPTLPLLHGEEG